MHGFKILTFVQYEYHTRGTRIWVTLEVIRWAQVFDWFLSQADQRMGPVAPLFIAHDTIPCACGVMKISSERHHWILICHTRILIRVCHDVMMSWCHTARVHKSTVLKGIYGIYDLRAHYCVVDQVLPGTVEYRRLLQYIQVVQVG